MKVLIAYDGSICADAALDDLARAGLPEQGEILIVSVAESWLPIDQSPRGYARAETLACHAKQRVGKVLPSWSVSSLAVAGSPGREILAKADEFGSDLIVTGAQGCSGIGRFVLGSISHKILNEARCSVRVGRAPMRSGYAAARIMIAFDGSGNSFTALKQAAARRWPADGEIRVLCASNPPAPTGIGRFLDPPAEIAGGVYETERTWLESRFANARTVLDASGLPVGFEIRPGNPKQIVTDEAAHWEADCIFVSACTVSEADHSLVGSTAAAITARSSTSVEVVRSR